MPCLACPREWGTFSPTSQQWAAAVSAAPQLLGMCGRQEVASGVGAVGRTK